MTLTPTLKFIIIALATATALVSEFWIDIDVELTDDLGMSDALYSVVNKALSKLDLLMSGLLVYLGLKAPTTKDVDASK